MNRFIPIMLIPIMFGAAAATTRPSELASVAESIPASLRPTPNETAVHAQARLDAIKKAINPAGKPKMFTFEGKLQKVERRGTSTHNAKGDRIRIVLLEVQIDAGTIVVLGHRIHLTVSTFIPDDPTAPEWKPNEKVLKVVGAIDERDIETMLQGKDAEMMIRLSPDFAVLRK